MATITVLLNESAVQIEAEQTLLDVLIEQKLAEKKGIAVAVNNQVISRARWQNINLNDADKILIITATQGG